MAGQIFSIGKAFSGNSINSAIYRGDGLISVDSTVYFAYYRSSTELVVGVLNIAVGDCLEVVISDEFNLSDAHNIVSLAIDSMGHIFLAIGGHCTPITVLRSTLCFSIKAWEDVSGGLSETSVVATYPTFLRNGGNLWLGFREGHPTMGDWRLAKFDFTNKVFCTPPINVLVGASSNNKGNSAYLNRIAIWKDRFALLYLWRTNSLGDRSAVVNVGFDFIWLDPDGLDAFDMSGLSLGLPVSCLCSPRVFSLPIECDVINQCGLDCSYGVVHSVFYYRPSRKSPLRWCYLRGNGENWSKTLSSPLAVQFRLSGLGTLSLPYSRPAVLASRSQDVFVIYRDSACRAMLVQRLRAPAFSFEASDLRIIDTPPVGYSEPVIDFGMWRRAEILCMFVQYCDQPDNEGAPDVATSDSFIVTLDLISDWDSLKTAH